MKNIIALSMIVLALGLTACNKKQQAAAPIQTPAVAQQTASPAAPAMEQSAAPAEAPAMDQAAAPVAAPAVN